MNNFKNILFSGLLSSLALFMVACSDTSDESTEKEKAKGDHIWKTQTDALQTAKDTAKKLQENLNLQQEKMDENH